MQKFVGIMLNLTFFTFVVIIAVAVSTIALTRKVNEYREDVNQGVKGTVVKQKIPVLSLSEGVVDEIHVKVGQEVKKGDQIVEVNNPVLSARVSTLEQFEDNASAQTEATVARQQLGRLDISSPVDGVISEVSVIEGAPLDYLSNVVTMYGNDNVRLLARLDVNQYLAVRRLTEVRAYSPRLNQSFVLKPDVLQPDISEADEEEKAAGDEKKIGLFLNFKNKDDVQSLLDNEDLELRLYDEEKITKPVDVFVDFWNGMLGEGNAR